MACRTLSKRTDGFAHEQQLSTAYAHSGPGSAAQLLMKRRPGVILQHQQPSSHTLLQNCRACRTLTWACMRLGLSACQPEHPNLCGAGQHSKVLVVGVQQQRLALSLIKHQRLLHNTCRTTQHSITWPRCTAQLLLQPYQLVTGGNSCR